MAALTLPDIQRSTPVTITADSPVLNVFQPVAKTSFSDTFRNPVDGIVITDQVIFYRCHLDEPGFSRIVDQRCIASPAMRIIMLKLRRIEKLALLVKVNQHKRVCILYKFTGIWCLRSHLTFSVYKLYKRKIILTAHAAVIFTKSRCDMNNTGTIAHGYIIITYYKMSFFALFLYKLAGAFK